MLDSLFGAQLGTMAKFAIAFVLVLGLIGITALILKRFGSGNMPTSGGGRNRQPRLAVLDSAVVDSKRRLVLIRRDNSEHLLLIGGPSDVVVEANINRAGPVTAGAERRSRGAPPQDFDAFDYAPPPEMDIPAPQPVQRGPAPAPRQRDMAPRPQLRPQPEPEPFDDLPLAPTRPEPQAEPAAYSPPPPLPRPAAHPSAAAPAQPRNEPNYSEMQQKMEAALRSPAAAPPPRSAHTAPQPRPSAPPPPMPQTRPMPAAAQKPSPPPAPAPSRQDASNPFDSLEAEMASLLGQDKKS